ncbi:MAG: tRNA adenosine(34) deaminase TadA [Candidatus Saccharicenans sp.]|nr:tRNA adenosine(34) deaminase TadA [Candidatus Saccharicenans sp.]MDH7492545.1 tRNA adenosine(34) deaminase TadA [Candidatus Saccharicenans sp.]
MKKEAFKDDVYFMRLALAEARKAADRGEVPVGAVLVEGQQLLARGHNRPLAAADPTAHAEIVVLRRAARKAGNYRLPGSTLYVTVEPCPMCLGAIIQARVKKLVYATEDPKAGAVVSRLKFNLAAANHRPEIRAGVCREEASRLLKDFFKEKRLEKNKRGRAVAKLEGFK